MLAKGLGLLSELRRAGVPQHRGAADLAVEGQGRAEALTFTVKGARHRIACDTVFLHQGVVANTQASRSLELAHIWDDRERAFRPEVGVWGETDIAGLFVAGDGAGIGGAAAAEEAGRIAALEAACQAGRIDTAERDRLAQGPRRRLAAERSVRPFLNAAYLPSRQILDPDDATIICRCEEVTAGAVRGFARLGCEGPNQTKAFGRVGMGPCQGRYCGLTVTNILAKATGRTPQEVGSYRIRQPLKPVTLGELASLAGRDEG